MFSPQAPKTGQPTQFSSLSTGAPPLTSSWRFGDGKTATGGQLSHTFTAAGTYTVVVTATDAITAAHSSINVTLNVQ